MYAYVCVGIYVAYTTQRHILYSQWVEGVREAEEGDGEEADRKEQVLVDGRSGRGWWADLQEIKIRYTTHQEALEQRGPHRRDALKSKVCAV